MGGSTRFMGRNGRDDFHHEPGISVRVGAWDGCRSGPAVIAPVGLTDPVRLPDMKAVVRKNENRVHPSFSGARGQRRFPRWMIFGWFGVARTPSGEQAIGWGGGGADRRGGQQGMQGKSGGGRPGGKRDGWAISRTSRSILHRFPPRPDPPVPPPGCTAPPRYPLRKRWPPRSVIRRSCGRPHPSTRAAG